MVLTLALLAVLLTFALVIYNVIGPSEFCKIVPSTHCTTNQLPQLPSTVVQATLREDRTSLTILSSLKVFFVENSFCRQRVGPTICEFLGSGEVFSQQIFLFYDHSTPLLRSMKQRAVIWPVVDNLIEPLPPPPPSLLTHHPTKPPYLSPRALSTTPPRYRQSIFPECLYPFIPYLLPNHPLPPLLPPSPLSLITEVLTTQELPETT